MSLTKNELNALCAVAKIAAFEAGKHIQSQIDQRHATKHKTAGDTLASQVVTAVDFQAQEIILGHLEKSIEQYDLGLLSEEIADDRSRHEKQHFWCIDPLDGTLPFTEGRTGYAVSIALVSCSGDPDIGVVYIPDLKDCYTCVRGEGVWLNDALFLRDEPADAEEMQLFMDRSFRSEGHLDLVTSSLKEFATKHNYTEINYHTQFGAVRNAIEVMNSSTGCYFKLPKQGQGGGSIWDFAATSLFFDELNLFVSNAKGDCLHLNKSKNTFMNEQGIIYSTDERLFNTILALGDHINRRRM